jgi:hypothetical protein
MRVALKAGKLFFFLFSTVAFVSHEGKKMDGDDNDDGDDNERAAGFLADDDECEDDLMVDAICKQLKDDDPAASKKDRKRPRLDNAAGAERGRDERGSRVEVEAFEDLVQVTRGRRRAGISVDGVTVQPADRPGEILFWSQGLIGMTALDAVNADRPDELHRLLILDPYLANSFEPTRFGEVTGILTLLQKAVHLGHFTCATVLIKAGARGALDILTKTESNLRLDALPYLMPGCTREELRQMEMTRLASGKVPIAVQLLESSLHKRSGGRWKEWKDHSNSRKWYETALAMWLFRTGADDFRTSKGESLQDYAAFREHWTFLYRLQRRAMLTLMCVWHWTYHVNPSFCRIPAIVMNKCIIPLIFQPAYCFVCERGLRSTVVCGGCRMAKVPCSQCRGRYRAEDEHIPHLYPLCDKCEQPVCRDCVNRCLAAPVMNDCRGVFCSRCAPGTCEDCFHAQRRMALHIAQGRDNNDDDDDDLDEWEHNSEMMSSASSEAESDGDNNEDDNDEAKIDALFNEAAPKTP